ncbi:hypothetical protein [Natrinema hispanicum]|uniref:hypothetical protein n=1 Tax=Natrinema hispanicum TaxID=392421 RepID=UPI000A63BCBD|nr:hypothetical protein [Natrinema hispanicum]
MNELYYFGLLLLLSGGFLALNSTGIVSAIGVGALFSGTLIGVLGLLQSRLSKQNK